MEDRTTSRYKQLHDLSPSQVAAITVLMQGGTHEEAASAGGVHRVTVTKWGLEHPAFVAELNRRKADLAHQAAALVSEVTRSAIGVIKEAITAGNLEAAFRWLHRVSPATITTTLDGPTTSDEVVEEVRRTLPGRLDELLRGSKERTAEDAEEAISKRLDSDEAN